MFQAKRVCIAVAVCVSVVAAASSTGSGGAKLELVQRVLHNQGRYAGDPVLADAARRAAGLVEIAYSAPGDEGQLVIRTDGRVACDAYSVDGGTRCVIDVYNALNLVQASDLPGSGSPLVKDVHTSLRSLEPEFVSRVTVDLLVPAEPRIRVLEDRVEVGFVQAPNAATHEGRLEEIAAELDRQRLRVAVARARFAEHAARAAYASHPASSDLSTELGQAATASSDRIARHEEALALLRRQSDGADLQEVAEGLRAEIVRAGDYDALAFRRALSESAALACTKASVASALDSELARLRKSTKASSSPLAELSQALDAMGDRPARPEGIQYAAVDEHEFDFTSLPVMYLAAEDSPEPEKAEEAPAAKEEAKPAAAPTPPPPPTPAQTACEG